MGKVTPASTPSTKTVEKPRSRRAVMKGKVKGMVVGKFYPMGLKPQKLPKSALGLMVFYVFHTILILFHIVLALYTIFSKHYNLAKNYTMAVAYHHHRTPQLIKNDLKGLSKTPKHVGVVLQYKESEEGGGIEGLIEHIAEIASWSLGASVTTLTIYERTGKVIDMHPEVYKAVQDRLKAFYGDNVPTFSLYSPKVKKYYTSNDAPTENVDLQINLISHYEGREFLVDLTKKLAHEAQSGVVKSDDVTVDLVNDFVTKSTFGEPDLIVLFSPKLDLDGFPPWHIRLSEIYYAHYNETVEYSIFIRGIRRYAQCKINVGR
ncbi:Decaprenyl diphosphate synthase-like protein [Dipodascopsis tothii]|uniref:Decaprenyl diphosphate synthase-like protein n=1 Tax=Dipodascopsis tothii TaxID=44089 RepID=UPI0034CDC1F5